MDLTYTSVQVGFVMLTLIYYGILLSSLRAALKSSDFELAKQQRIFTRVLLGLFGWTFFISLLSLLGVFSDFSTFPPPVGIVLVIPLVTLTWGLLFSKTTKQILRFVKPYQIIHLQSFRFFVEILLWMIFTVDLLPVQMTFEGRNWDILAGITAPVIAYIGIKKLSWPKWVLVIWNLICLGLLINIVVTALLSMPTPYQYFMNEPSNTIVTRFPIIWLPGLLVPLAYGLHFLSLRQLLAKSS